MFTAKIDQHPAAVALLDVFDGEPGCFAAAEAAADR
jgi:hypothetical protein